MPSFTAFPRYHGHARLLWRTAPGASIACLLLEATAAAATTSAMVASGRLIGALATAAPAADTWRWLAILLLLLVAGPTASVAAHGIEQWVSARYLAGYEDLVLDTGVRPFGTAHLEDMESARRISDAAAGTLDWLFLRGIDGTWGLLAARLSGIGAVIIVAGWRWWVPVPVIAAWAVLSRAVTNWNSARFDDLAEVTGTDRRRADYLRSILCGRGAAKEIRLFGALDWLREAYVATWRRTMAAITAHRRRAVRATLLPMCLVLLATGGAFVLLARDVWTHRAGTSALVTLVQAILALSAFGPKGDDQASLNRVTATLNRLAAFRADLGLPFLPPAPIASHRASTDSGPVTVDIRGVSFSYRGNPAPVLDGLDLRIPAGQSIAIVGVNGAGKSTLIKLLCGLYAVTTGTIRIDGADPAREPCARGRISVIFQEFLRYQLSMRANVEAGVSWHRLPDSVLDQVVADAGVEDIARRGWDTVLSSQYTGGTDLSGGQWQRVALARALAAVHSGAGLLILDEPTSALDVRAEAELFERLLRLSAGLTTILVSHRLSSVRHADRIVVLSGGRVIEDGTHAELLAAQGEYAHMFRLQASRFQAAGAGGRR